MTVRVDDKVWRALEKKLKGRKGSVRVGVLDSKGGAATHSDSNLTIAELMAIHEFGGGNVPERSSIRRTFREKEKEVAQVTAKLARGMLDKRATTMTLEKALNLLGIWATAEIKKTIRGNIPPPLKDATVARKGSSTALIDTGQLINSITHEVVTSE